jgi:uncharacterized protein YkwD
MHPFPTVRARALSVIALALAAGLMCQAPAFAETTTPSTPTTPQLSSITGISTTNGVENTGAEVVITGTNFVGVSAVAFGSSPATTFTANSSTSITAVTPALPAGTYQVAVTNAAGTTVAAKYTVRTFEAEVLRLVNEARGTARKCGSTRYKATGPLRWDSTLAKVATSHSKDMADHDYFSHDSRNGKSPFQRMKKAGYRYTSAGENIAAGFRSPASVVKAWLKSPGHCKNVMNRSYDELGVGFATGGTYGTYWTQDFGNPR